MSEPTGNLVKQLGSYITVALLTALVTTSLAVGQYKNKIDTVITENMRLQQTLVGLSKDLNDLRVEVSFLRGEMIQTRRALAK